MINNVPMHGLAAAAQPVRTAGGAMIKRPAAPGLPARVLAPLRATPPLVSPYVDVGWSGDTRPAERRQGQDQGRRGEDDYRGAEGLDKSEAIGQEAGDR
jgi:hypothetical protein